MVWFMRPLKIIYLSKVLHYKNLFSALFLQYVLYCPTSTPVVTLFSHVQICSHVLAYPARKAIQISSIYLEM